MNNNGIYKQKVRSMQQFNDRQMTANQHLIKIFCKNSTQLQTLIKQIQQFGSQSPTTKQWSIVIKLDQFKQHQSLIRKKFIDQQIQISLNSQYLMTLEEYQKIILKYRMSIQNKQLYLLEQQQLQQIIYPPDTFVPSCTKLRNFTIQGIYYKKLDNLLLKLNKNSESLQKNFKKQKQTDITIESSHDSKNNSLSAKYTQFFSQKIQDRIIQKIMQKIQYLDTQMEDKLEKLKHYTQVHSLVEKDNKQLRDKVRKKQGIFYQRKQKLKEQLNQTQSIISAI